MLDTKLVSGKAAQGAVISKQEEGRKEYSKSGDEVGRILSGVQRWSRMWVFDILDQLVDDGSWTSQLSIKWSTRLLNDWIEERAKEK